MNRNFIFLILLLCAAGAPAQDWGQVPYYGEAVGGFPTWEERVLHQLTNRARVDPDLELSLGCSGLCGTAEMTCYSPMAPLTYSYNLNEAARFHSVSMIKMNFWSHDTPCVLKPDLLSLYPEIADGSYASSCSGAGTTSFAQRLSRFGVSSGTLTENIAVIAPPDPIESFYVNWLYEAVPAEATCTAGSWGNQTNGHRVNILKQPGPGIGNGAAVGGPTNLCGFPDCAYYTQDYGPGTAPQTLKLVSGAHWGTDNTRQAANVVFWTNWYDVAGPTEARVVINGVAYPLTLGRGSTTNGAWTTTLAGFGTGCHRYYFSFRDSGGTQYTFPTTGSFGLGPAGTCVDWSSSRSTAVKGDLNADGRADLIWRNILNGQNSFWLLNGTAVIGGGSLNGVPDTAWELGGTGDFNADGQTDLVWHHNSAGANTVWYMAGVSYSSQAGLPGLADTNWHVAGVGDLNGDTRADLIWRNFLTGENSAWFMSGTTASGGGSIEQVPVNWKLAGVGDVNADGRGDLVWWDSVSGGVAVWFMNGTTRSATWFVGQVADTSWRVSAIGDFNGDGRADILWRNSVGGTAIWFLDGISVLGGGFVGAVADTNWRVAGPK